MAQEALATVALIACSPCRAFNEPWLMHSLDEFA